MRAHKGTAPARLIPVSSHEPLPASRHALRSSIDCKSVCGLTNWSVTRPCWLLLGDGRCCAVPGRDQQDGHGEFRFCTCRVLASEVKDEAVSHVLACEFAHPAVDGLLVFQVVIRDQLIGGVGTPTPLLTPKGRGPRRPPAPAPARIPCHRRERASGCSRPHERLRTATLRQRRKTGLVPRKYECPGRGLARVRWGSTCVQLGHSADHAEG